MSLTPPVPLDYFSLRTPLKGVFSEVLTSMMRPVSLSRLAQLPLGVWRSPAAIWCAVARPAPSTQT